MDPSDAEVGAKRDGALIDDALALTFRISRLHGHTPLWFETLPSGTFSYPTRTMFCVSLIFTLFMGGQMLILIIYFTGPNFITDRFDKNYLILINSVILATYATGLIQSLSRMKCLLYCVKSVRKIKANITSTTLTDSNKVYLTIAIGAFYFGLWIKSTLNAYMKSRPYLFYYGICYSFDGLMILQIQFALIVTDITSAFKDINNQLESILSNLKLKSNVDKNRSRTAAKVRKLAKSFISTCEIVRKLKDTEQVLLLLHFVFLTLYLILSIDNLITLKNTVIINGSMTIEGVVFEAVRIIYVIGKTLLLVEPCHRYHSEILNTKSIISRIMCHLDSEDDELLPTMDSFFKQLMLNDVSFSALGVCTIGRVTMSTMFGGGTTAYMILKDL